MSLRLPAAVVAALLAGCVPPTGLAPADDLSTAPDLLTAPLAVAYALPPVEVPHLPAALRTGPTPATAVDHAAMGHTMPPPAGSDPAAMEHAGTDHASTDHTMPAPAAELRPEALAPAVEAYLALHAALAADRLAAAGTAAGALAAALPAGVGPDLQAHAAAAGAATDLDGLRAAFGRLSPPFIALVERVGPPPGIELSAFRCGMADAPEGGVWIQATGDLANPYFGTAMRTCGRETGPVGHDAAGHEAGRHETGTQHD